MVTNQPPQMKNSRNIITLNRPFMKSFQTFRRLLEDSDLAQQSPQHHLMPAHHLH